MAGGKDLGSRVTIRQCTHDDFVAMAKVANEVEHWNESIVDLELWGRYFPGGAFAAILDGKPVGFSMAFVWTDHDAFGGMSIVLPEYRGRGIGNAVWAERRKHVGDRNFGVSSVNERIGPNERIGFKAMSGQTCLFAGTLELSKLGTPGNQDGINVGPLSSDSFNQVVEYDKVIYKVCSRGSYLKEWFNKENTKTLVATKNGEVLGYGCVQPANEGYRLSPLYANTEGAYRLMLHGLLSGLPDGTHLTCYLPFENKAAVSMAEGLGLSQPMKPLMKMHTQHGYDVDWQKVYCLMGAEISHV